MKNDTSRTTSDLACHAALPALVHRDPEVAKAAVGVLDAAAKGLETAGQPEPLGSLLVLLARTEFQLGDAAGGRKRLEAYLESTEKSAVRYAGDYPLYLRKQQLERVAAEFARAGLWRDALAALGRFLDAPAYSGGDPPADNTLLRVLARIESSPAKEQYQTLHDWSMPEKDRRTVRFLSAGGMAHNVPAVFSADGRQGGRCIARQLWRSSCRGREHGAGADRRRPPSRHARPACRRSPRRCSAENGQAGRERPDASSPGRAGARQGAGVVPDIDSRTAELMQGKPGQAGRRTRDRPHRGTAGLGPGRAAGLLRDRFATRGRGARRQEPSGDRSGRAARASACRARRKAGSRSGLARARALLAQAVARKEGAPAVLENTNLAWWHPANTAYQPEGGWSPDYWTAQDGVVAHLSGSGVDLLLFDYPLGGTYEFSVDTYDGRVGRIGAHAQRAGARATNRARTTHRSRRSASFRRWSFRHSAAATPSTL